jgi:hypothetical protein
MEQDRSSANQVRTLSLPLSVMDSLMRFSIHLSSYPILPIRLRADRRRRIRSFIPSCVPGIRVGMKVRIRQRAPSVRVRHRRRSMPLEMTVPT